MTSLMTKEVVIVSRYYSILSCRISAMFCCTISIYVTDINILGLFTFVNLFGRLLLLYVFDLYPEQTKLMKIRHGLCILCLFVGVYVLICVSLQRALWREQLRGAEEVCM